MEAALAAVAGAAVWWLWSIVERHWANALLLLFAVVCLRLALTVLRWLLR